MNTISVSVPEELREKMIELEEVNWSAVARKAFEEKVKEIEIFKKISLKSRLKETDTKAIAEKINNSMARKFRGM